MEQLAKLRALLKRRSQIEMTPYAIPVFWSCWGYRYSQVVDEATLRVHPYDYYFELINYLLNNKVTSCPQGQSLARHQGKDDGGAWIKDGPIYSLLVRLGTAFAHDPKGIYQSQGTLLKTIGLIPHLMRIGVNTLYLLPVSRIGEVYRKGSLGSPYAVADFFDIDPLLADPLVDLDASQQLQALAQALHLVGIRLVLDFIPRTASRASSLLMTNPEWFYYIKKSDVDDYQTPTIEELPPLTPATPEVAGELYTSPNVKQFIKLFQVDPRTADPDNWRRLLERFNGSRPFLEYLEEQTGLTTAPAFADVINDPQQPWSDVTYLRLYLDHPIAAAPYLDDDQPPYLLFDVAKSSLNPGRLVNTELWRLIASIIPHYQKLYGIDGARIDMGHALPSDLTRMIVEAARNYDPSFALIAEELNNLGAKAASDQGYNLILGDGFFALPRADEFLFHAFVYNADSYQLPLLFQAESHDTPRIAARPGGENQARAMAAFSLFVPGAVPFINCGQELLQVVPINSGLDSQESDQPMGLFDPVFFDYRRGELVTLYHQLGLLRDKVISDQYLPLGFLHMREKAAGFAYLHPDCAFLVIVHSDFRHGESLTVRFDNVKKQLQKDADSLEVVYSTARKPACLTSFNYDGSLNLWMEAGEMVILKY